MPSIYFIGPGSIGGTLAAWLAQSPNNSVSIAARTPFSSLELTTPDGIVRATPRVLTNPSQASVSDWVFVATKAYDSAAAALWFPTTCGPNTRLAVVQNGVEHIERFAKHFDRNRIVPVMIDCPADRTAPGRITQRGPVRMVVPQNVNGADFVALFAGTKVEATQSPDFTTAVWKKLCLNSMGAVSAVLAKPQGIVHHAGVADVMRAIMRECIAVGRAEGAKLDDALVEEIIERMRRAPPNSTNSMLVDRLAGRPMEIDARNDVIVRLGRKHGIATPMNALMVALLEAAQSN